MGKGSQDRTHRERQVSGESVAPKHGPGRKSLSGDGDTPQIKVRVPASLQQQAKDFAVAEGKTLSDITRQALEHLLVSQRREVMVQRELHRTLLGKLLDTGIEPYRDIIRHNLHKSRNHVRGSQAENWIEEWSQLLDGPPSRLIDVFLDVDEHSIDMRQMSPFAGVLTNAERLQAIKRARTHAPS